MYKIAESTELTTRPSAECLSNISDELPSGVTPYRRLSLCGEVGYCVRMLVPPRSSRSAFIGLDKTVR